MDVCPGCFVGRKVAVSFFALGLSAVTASANLFVSDSNHDVVNQYDSSGALVNTISITGPTGLAFGPDGNLYVATPYDNGFGSGTSVEVYNPATGGHLSTFTTHVADSSLNNPAALAFDSSGHLYVGDLQNKILVYNSSGGNHTAELTDNNLSNPSGLAFGPSGALYVADQSGNVLKYAAGTFSVVNTSGAQMNGPHDVVVGADGNLYVLDTTGSSGGLYSLNPNTGFATELINYATSPFMPNDMALGPDGNLYLSGVDGNSGSSEILEVSTNGFTSSVYLDLGVGSYPTYLAFSPVPVPEPSVLALGAVTGVALFARRVRRKASAAK